MLGIPELHHYGHLETCGFDLYSPSVRDCFVYILDIMYLWRNVCSHPLSDLGLGYLAVLKTELALRDLNYVLDTSPLSVICLENISSHFYFLDVL